MDQEAADPTAAVLRDLRAGAPVLSLGVRHSRTADIARMALGAGYRCLWIDLEHSPMPVDTAAAIAATADDLGMAAWVRVPERDLGTIGRLLDGGATGIIAPKVESAAEARAVARACRFAPRGDRSQLALVPQRRFRRLPQAEMTAGVDAGVAVQILIESAAGVAAAAAIAAVDGVDLLAVGCNDLCADLGHPGEPGHPDVARACHAVAAAAREHGKLAVVGGLGDGARFELMLAAGFAPLIFAGIDTDLLVDALATRASGWRDRPPSPPTPQE